MDFWFNASRLELVDGVWTMITPERQTLVQYVRNVCEHVCGPIDAFSVDGVDVQGSEVHVRCSVRLASVKPELVEIEFVKVQP